MLSLPIVLVLSILCLVRYALVPLLLSKTAQHRATSSYPHRDPLFGLDLAIQTWRDFQRGELCEGLRRRHLQYGATFAANTLGAATVYTTEPDNIRAVTTHAFANFAKAGWVAEAAKHIGSGVLLNDGDAWRHSRTMLKPMFSRAMLDEPALLEPHVQSLVKEMRRLAQSGRGVFDFHELASLFALDIVTQFLFGRSTDCLGRPEQLDGKDGVKFLSLVKRFEAPSGQFIAVGPLAWLGLITSYKRLTGLVDGMKAFFRTKLADIIADATWHGCASRRYPSLLPVSSSIFRSMKAAGISDDRIQGELQNIFFASYDTTSTFLANVMYVLVRHPDVQQQIRHEMARFQGRPPTSKELAGLPFLKMVIMEALRLYSPVSSHSRTAQVDTTLPRGGGPDGQGPFVVRAGATVVWSTYTLNRDPRRYGDDWADFRPGRWAASRKRAKGDNTTTAAGGATAAGEAKGGGDRLRGSAADASETGENGRDFFMPFGSGPRTCLGQAMVQAEVMYVVVRLLQEFPSLAMDAAHVGRPFKEAKAVSFYNEGGVHVRVLCG